jgi:hypothetical protein
MSSTIKVALAGAGAFGIKHLDGIKNIDGVEVISLISRDLDKTRETLPTNTASATSPPIWPIQPGAEGSRRGHPLHADADARQPDAPA